MECPRGVEILGDQSSFSPSAMRNCSRTRSIPLVSSETGCSTCSRVFTSRNETVPSCADQELDGAGAVVAGLHGRSPWPRCGSWPRCSSVRNGAGASSTSFW